MIKYIPLFNRLHSNWIEKKKCFFGGRLIWILCAGKRNDTALPDILSDGIFICVHIHIYITCTSHILCTYVRDLRLSPPQPPPSRPRALIAYQRGRRAIDGGIGRKAWWTWMHRITRALTQVAGARSAFLSCAWYHRSVRTYTYVYRDIHDSISRQVM